MENYDDYVFRMLRSRYNYKIFRLGTVSVELGLNSMILWTSLSRLRSAGKLDWHEKRGATFTDKELLIMFPS